MSIREVITYHDRPSDTLGIVVDGFFEETGGQPVKRTFSVVRAGDLYVPENYTEDTKFSISVHAHREDPGSIHRCYLHLRKWLFKKGTEELRFRSRYGIFYRVKKVEITPETQKFFRAGTWKIGFTCYGRAFVEDGDKYLHNDITTNLLADSKGHALITSAGSGILVSDMYLPEGESPLSNNDGIYDGERIKYLNKSLYGYTVINPYGISRPVYRIEGTGMLRINGNDITVSCPSVIIDTLRMVAYKDDSFMNGYIKGNYEDMWLQPGRNEIVIPGEMTVDIAPNWEVF